MNNNEMFNGEINEDSNNGMQMNNEMYGNNMQMNNNGQNNGMNNNGMYNNNQNNGMYNNGQNNGMQMNNNYGMGNQMQNGQMQGYGVQTQNNQMYSNMNGMQQNYGQTQMMNNDFSMGNDMNMNNGQMQGMDMGTITEYKKALRSSVEVQRLTGEVEVQNPNSIIMFGQGASENISKISDELLNSMKSVKAEEAGEMLVNLTKIMDKFDIKEIENTEKPSMFSKFMKNVGNSVAKLFQKYDRMGMEVEKIYVLLKKYETDIKQSNAHLKKLYDGNIHYYQLLEKYIVAGEIALEEIDMYIGQIGNDMTMNEEQKHMMIQKLEISKEMLSQRVYDLQIAENVAIQAAPMIQTIQMSNFNLMRKINSSFIVTLPIFKQCLAQAVILKRQEIQAKSIKQLDEKTNELIMRNAANTARQSVEIAKMASGSSVAISTLEKSYETIMKGIEDTKAIQEANRNERMENSKRLEVIKHDMKKNISNI